ncbi:MAG TPA: helix-turn-helix domain-containing protein, partial [Humisphaera sp.]|nr:helix-turn-helix domain-containing protein [Humisphaera sp.]
MKQSKKYKSDIKEAIHEIAGGLHGVGMIDKQTMRRFDVTCLAPIHQFSAREIKALRQREEVSQSVFAAYLNVTKDSVSKWERGEK